MSNFKPIGKWIWVQSHLGGQKETEAGIIYNEVVKTRYVWGTVAAIGDKITEDIRVGDRVLWDRTQNKGQGHEDKDMVHQDWIALVER
jgi:co-chaperonin GroES (HSP10)